MTARRRQSAAQPQPPVVAVLGVAKPNDCKLRKWLHGRGLTIKVVQYSTVAVDVDELIAGTDRMTL